MLSAHMFADPDMLLQELIYAGQKMDDDSKLMKDYFVPPGCQALIAIERAKLELGKPEIDSAYWN